MANLYSSSNRVDQPIEAIPKQLCIPKQPPRPRKDDVLQSHRDQDHQATSDADEYPLLIRVLHEAQHCDTCDGDGWSSVHARLPALGCPSALASLASSCPGWTHPRAPSGRAAKVRPAAHFLDRMLQSHLHARRVLAPPCHPRTHAEPTTTSTYASCTPTLEASGHKVQEPTGINCGKDALQLGTKLRELLGSMHEDRTDPFIPARLAGAFPTVSMCR